jgi:hypothetical protein
MDSSFTKLTWKIFNIHLNLLTSDPTKLSLCSGTTLFTTNYSYIYAESDLTVFVDDKLDHPCNACNYLIPSHSFLFALIL